MALNLAGRWRAFFDSRAPLHEQQDFTQRNVYIVPSKSGFGFALVVLILLLAAINEQINLGYALAFLLGGVALSGMSRSHGNVRGLQLTLNTSPGLHAGQAVSIPVQVSPGLKRRDSWSLRLDAAGGSTAWVDVPAGQAAAVSLTLPAAHRGWLSLPRIKLMSRYPLGLFTVWGHWRPAQRLLIWPALEPDAPPPPETGTGDGGRSVSAALLIDQDEQLREWRHGDSLRQVAWKKSATRMASGLGPITREGLQQVHREHWLNWSDTQGLHLEARLSRLATWLLRAEQAAQLNGQPYGLRMPGQDMPCAQGPEHLRACLDLLATWGQT